MSVFNGERFLAEAIESILHQSFRDFEFIVIDDGSTDCSRALLNHYQQIDDRIRVYCQENRGLVESLNRGCALARGKYIARMDADDVSVENRLLWQVELLEKTPGVALVGGAFETIDASGNLLSLGNPPLRDRDIKSALAEYCPLLHPTILMRRDVFTIVGGYRKVVVDAEDYDLWLRIAERFSLANLNAVVLKYRIHPFQVSVRRWKQEAVSGLAARTAAVLRRSGAPDPLDSVEQITPAVLTSLGVSDAAQESSIAAQFLRFIRNLYRAGEYSLALTAVDEIFRTSDWKHAENWVAADLRFFAARLYWRGGRFVGGISMGVGAVLTRPKILGRPLKLLLRRICGANLAPSAG
jgi:hypothetical protein